MIIPTSVGPMYQHAPGDWKFYPPAELTFPQIDETLLDAGVDPQRTPVDALPEHAQWALATHYWSWESGEDAE